jgi:hypothetical protein
MNGGTCTDGKCVCTAGYTGEFCTERESQKNLHTQLLVLSTSYSWQFCFLPTSCCTFDVCDTLTDFPPYENKTCDFFQPYVWTRAETGVDASVQTAALASTDSRGTTAKRVLIQFVVALATHSNFSMHNT